MLTLILGLIMLVPAGYAAGIRFGSCPTGYECSETPSGDGGPFPPHAVTGHTIYANFIRERVANNTLGLPTDFAVIAGYFADIDNRTVAIQRECVVWFNGQNVDQRPDPDAFADGENAFPSDEDEPLTNDTSYQDYDFDRDIENCLPAFDDNVVVNYPAFAVAVEAGDCDPGGADATSHRFRGHLDFVDPNNIYHEVQEYDYQCYFFGPGGGLGYTAAMTATADVQNAEDPIFGLPGGFDDGGQWLEPSGGLVPDVGQDLGNGPTSDLIKDMFPWTYTDRHNEQGCAIYETPADGNGEFDLGHKCNGSVQDLFLERMWMTALHDIVHDPTIDNIYNFALQIDTCAGWNIYEGPTPLNSPGKDEMGVDSGGPATGTRYASGAEQDPQGGSIISTNQLDLYHDVAYDFYYGAGLDGLLGGWPLFDVCTDGSSFSFDDTPRGRTVHSGAPAGIGSTDIMRGNSYDFNGSSETFGKHRTNCRHNYIDWAYNTFPPGPPAVGDDCYPEDHKTAQIDIYVYYDDPTGGLWALNSNGMNGLTVPYPGPGCSTGPNDFPGPAGYTCVDNAIQP